MFVEATEVKKKIRYQHVSKSSGISGIENCRNIFTIDTNEFVGSQLVPLAFKCCLSNSTPGKKILREKYFLDTGTSHLRGKCQ